MATLEADSTAAVGSIARPSAPAADSTRDASEAPGILASDTAASDSIPADTPAPDTTYMLVIDPPEPTPLPEVPRDATSGLSWVLAAMLVIFGVVAIRYRHNSKYLASMFKDAVNTRLRANVFDETVRERSLVFLLNVLWCVSAGVLLYTLVAWTTRDASPADSLVFRLNPLNPLGLGIGIGVAACYLTFLTIAYQVVGNVFSDATHTRLWVNGFTATSGLATLIFFPLALGALSWPAYDYGILIAAGVGLLATKSVFIWKGFKIFFNESRSWLLFLYYLCSLEIVPLVLALVMTAALCLQFLR